MSSPSAAAADQDRKTPGRPRSVRADEAIIDAVLDLIALLTRVGQPPDARSARIMSCLLPEIHRSASMRVCYDNVVEPRRQAVREVLSRGVRTGELRPDIDIELTMSLLSAPVVLPILLQWSPAVAGDDLAARVVDAVFAGIAGPNTR
ncbi:MAG: hypothetical protein QOI74_3433 [Micromonosporaceae bacterium]|nr:hypothetical protein [Micromonosporaceae bacterium]